MRRAVVAAVAVFLLTNVAEARPRSRGQQQQRSQNSANARTHGERGRAENRHRPRRERNQPRSLQRQEQTQRQLRSSGQGRSTSSESRASRSSTSFEIGRFDGLRDAALKQALAGTNRPQLIGYRPARRHLFTEVDSSNGSVEDIYTGRVAQGITGIPSADSGPRMNTEHITPMSLLRRNNAKEFRTDMHHIMPSDTRANSMRGSYEFGEVVQPRWSEGGSKLGRNASGKRVFEPRDAVKGMIARAKFYVHVYGDVPMSAGEEAVLRRWHSQFPPTPEEQARTLRVAQTPQGNVNPFVLHPELVDRIDKF